MVRLLESLELSAPKRLDNPQIFGELVYEEFMPTDMDLKNQSIDNVLKILNDKDLLEDEMGVRLALDEAITNSIRHGNKRDINKKVHIELYVEGDKWSIIYSDEGEGFIPKEIPDFTDTTELFAEGGRGIFLMHYYMDSVHYCGKGNVIQLIRSRRVKK